MKEVLASSQKEYMEMISIIRDQELNLIEAEKYLENISYQSKMQLNLINDLLDLAKCETMNFSFNEEYFDLNELITQAKRTVKYQAN